MIMNTDVPEGRRSLRRRIFVSFILLLVVLQGATLLLMYRAYQDNFEMESTQRLQTGKTIFQNEFASREQYLITNVTTVSKDWGLRSALGQGDQETVRGALKNHSDRVEANIALVFDLQGAVIASTESFGSSNNSQLFSPSRASEEKIFSKIVIGDNQAYQMVYAPIKAPKAIGWVALGFSIDDALAQHFKNYSSLQTTFFEVSEQQLHILGSTLSSGQRVVLEELGIDSLLDTENIVHLQLNNQQVLQYSLPLIAGEKGNSYALIQQPLDELQQIFWSKSLVLLMIFAIGTSVASLVAYLLARTVSLPLQQLIKGVSNVGQGHYEQLSDNASYREIEQLAKEFNRMQVAIETRESEIRYRADHDELTGLYNRHTFLKHVKEVIDGLEENGGALINIMVIDIARFKEVVGTLGYEVGDKLNRQTAERLSDSLGDSFFIARIGNQFVTCHRTSRETNQVGTCSQHIHELFKQPFWVDDVELHLTLNIGVAVYPLHERTPEALLRMANIALDTARRTKQATCIYNRDEDFNSLLRLQIVGDMRRAIRNGELSLCYQPKVLMKGDNDFDSLLVSQVECLVRWIHPEHGFMPPDEFIPIAEQTGTIVDLTAWVLDSALQQCKLWRDNAINLSVAVNISTVDLRSASLVSHVTDLLQKYDLPADALLLEVTESAVVDDPEKANEILYQLRDVGVTLSIDDYGTGYSSLAQLKKLPVHELKIDKSFVLNMDTDEDDAKIVRSTIHLGHSMNLAVTAEGVETEKALKMLQKYGCDHMQGYFISKPLPIEQFDEWLRDKYFQGSVADQLEDCSPAT